MLAAISLLTDQDPKIAGACRDQILLWGDDVRGLLEMTCKEGVPELRRKSQRMLCKLDRREWCARVENYSKRIPRTGQMSWQDLEEGAVLLSSVGRVGQVDGEGLAKILDGFADELRPRFVNKSAVSCAKLLVGYLSGQLGFGGSMSSFYELSHIRFDKVLDLRRGVPVVLTLLYILVGRRAGLKVAGVAIPDHFLVRVHGTRPVLLDPYHEGRHMTKADCTRYLRLAGYSLHTASYLEDVPDRQILDCLLRDLLRVYGYREDNEFCSVLETARQTLMQA